MKGIITILAGMLIVGILAIPFPVSAATQNADNQSTSVTAAKTPGVCPYGNTPNSYGLTAKKSGSGDGYQYRENRKNGNGNKQGNHNRKGNGKGKGDQKRKRDGSCK